MKKKKKYYISCKHSQLKSFQPGYIPSGEKVCLKTYSILPEEYPTRRRILVEQTFLLKRYSAKHDMPPAMIFRLKRYSTRRMILLTRRSARWDIPSGVIYYHNRYFISKDILPEVIFQSIFPWKRYSLRRDISPEEISYQKRHWDIPPAYILHQNRYFTGINIPRGAIFQYCIKITNIQVKRMQTWCMVWELFFTFRNGTNFL
jgi:hypothetical protein